jgi:hypothetical protein
VTESGSKNVSRGSQIAAPTMGSAQHGPAKTAFPIAVYEALADLIPTQKNIAALRA